MMIIFWTDQTDDLHAWSGGCSACGTIVTSFRDMDQPDRTEQAMKFLITMHAQAHHKDFLVNELGLASIATENVFRVDDVPERVPGRTFFAIRELKFN